jgi:hypothetical protein
MRINLRARWAASRRKLRVLRRRKPTTPTRPVVRPVEPDGPSIPGDRRVKVTYVHRAGGDQTFTVDLDESVTVGTSTVWEAWVPREGINFLIQVEEFVGVKASRATVTLVNSVKGAGPFYYEYMEILYNGNNMHPSLSNKNGVVLPGGIMPIRRVYGEEDQKLLSYGHKSFPRKESWIEEKCKKAMSSFPTVTIGPWMLGFNGTSGDSSLNGSHGGYAVGPFQGGPNCWTRENPAAWMYKELEMLTVAARCPIAKTDTLGNPIVDPASGWMGRTWAHEKEGWQYHPVLKAKHKTSYKQWGDGDLYKIDGNGEFLKQTIVINGKERQVKIQVPSEWYWCDYEKHLFHYRAIDHTHYHRQIRAAAMLAEQDAFARWFLRMCWNDVANWLGSEGGIGELRNLPQMIEDTEAHKGAGWGGRGWAHILRSFLYAEPYLTPAEKTVPDSLDAMLEEFGLNSDWFGALRFATQYIATINGICHNKGGDKFPGTKNGEFARGREVDLMGPNFRKFNLPDLDTAWKSFCLPRDGRSLPESFQVTALSHWSHGAYWNASYFPGYDGIRGLFTEFGSANKTEVHSKMRTMLESPWDYHIRPDGI